jgi:hypothetical protein
MTNHHEDYHPLRLRKRRGTRERNTKKMLRHFSRREIPCAINAATPFLKGKKRRLELCEALMEWSSPIPTFLPERCVAIFRNGVLTILKNRNTFSFSALSLPKGLPLPPPPPSPQAKRVVNLLFSGL